jgi:hypothetical protein
VETIATNRSREKNCFNNPDAPKDEKTGLCTNKAHRYAPCLLGHAKRPPSRFAAKGNLNLFSFLFGYILMFY